MAQPHPPHMGNIPSPALVMNHVADSSHICVVCTEQVPREHIYHTHCCGVAYCQNCLRRMFGDAAKYEISQPPRCCELIPLQEVSHLIPADIVKVYTDRTIEWDTLPKDRTYCIACSHFIKVKNITENTATCSDCGAQTCAACKEKFHKGECVDNPVLQSFNKLADKSGWRRCPSCGIMVSRVHGCQHMVCICGTDFCYGCGGSGCSMNCVVGGARPDVSVPHRLWIATATDQMRTSYEYLHNGVNDFADAQRYLNNVMNWPIETQDSEPGPNLERFRRIGQAVTQIQALVFGIGEDLYHLTDPSTMGPTTNLLEESRTQSPSTHLSHKKRNQEPQAGSFSAISNSPLLASVRGPGYPGHVPPYQAPFLSANQVRSGHSTYTLRLPRLLGTFDDEYPDPSLRPGIFKARPGLSNPRARHNEASASNQQPANRVPGILDEPVDQSNLLFRRHLPKHAYTANSVSNLANDRINVRPVDMGGNNGARGSLGNYNPKGRVRPTEHIPVLSHHGPTELRSGEQPFDILARSGAYRNHETRTPPHVSRPGFTVPNPMPRDKSTLSSAQKACSHEGFKALAAFDYTECQLCRQRVDIFRQCYVCGGAFCEQCANKIRADEKEKATKPSRKGPDNSGGSSGYGTSALTLLSH